MPHSTSRSSLTTAALVLSVLLASTLVAPTPALASRLATDRIGGIALSTGQIPLSKAPNISARTGEIVVSSGLMLWTRSPDSRQAMASTTKVMTALLALETCRLTDSVTITKAASGVGYATGLRTGEKRTVRQLLELALVASSNDAATALAIHMGGSVPGFAKKMNARAKKLGLTHTHYVNPHGLDAKGHYTSATDLAKLMRTAMKKSEFRRIVKLRSVRLPAYKTRHARTLKSTDKLLGLVTGLMGGKTGFTDDAKYCFVGHASRNGITLTSVVLVSPTSALRFSSSKVLLEWGFAHYRVRELCSVTQTAGVVPLSANPAFNVVARYAETTSTVFFDVLGKATRIASLPTSVAVPVYQGQLLGTVKIMQGTKRLTTVRAVARGPMASAQETVGVVPVTGVDDRTVVAKTAQSSATVAVYNTARPVDRVVTLAPNVSAPVSAGQRLGTIVYSQDGHVIVTVPVVAAASVPLSSPVARVSRLLSNAWRTVTGQ